LVELAVFNALAKRNSPHPKTEGCYRKELGFLILSFPLTGALLLLAQINELSSFESTGNKGSVVQLFTQYFVGE
jgi:hypothetical protein